ncbi:MAG: alanine--tRNA ligase-related protein [Nanoarchaeota archaeon]
MEFFSRGLELGNQVYMWYEKTPTGFQDLKIKVLDMGMGHERNAWFTQGTPTAYEAVFPSVCKRLFEKTGIKPDAELIRKFIPYASYLNVDEIQDVDKTWGVVANNVGMDVKSLREHILPLAGLYSIGEHMRTLLVAFADGALPSNTGGGYNLRVLYRRAYSLAKQYNWDISFLKLCEMHSHYLKPIFPELNEHLDQVQTILDVEERKYLDMRTRSKGLIKQILENKVTTETLITAYDSHGINPQLIVEAGKGEGKDIIIPDDFYAQVAGQHTGTVDTATKKDHLPRELSALSQMDLPPTEGLYFADYRLAKGKAKVITTTGPYVILDQTIFYPTSGGQIHDLGAIDGTKVVDVFKHGNLIIHHLEKASSLRPGAVVNLSIDPERRLQLAQHHTATHILNAASREVLGDHINQAGARKTLEKGTLDITHYDILSSEEIDKIEKKANDIVKKGIPIHLSFMSRNDAEKKYGMRIYQGGVVPGKRLRIVNIKGVDVEACGGTHLNNTKEVGMIKIIKTSKVQDGVIRLEYSAGKALQAKSSQETDVLGEVATLLGCTPAQVPGRCAELFQKWKAKVKKGKDIDPTLTSTEETVGSDAEVLKNAASILKTQPEHIPKTITRFLNELR